MSSSRFCEQFMNNSDSSVKKARILHARVDEFWRKGQKYEYLDERQHAGSVAWQELQPDAKHNWLTEGMRDEFESFVPVGNKETKTGKGLSAGVFNLYSAGVNTARDAWVYNFDLDVLYKNVKGDRPVSGDNG